MQRGSNKHGPRLDDAIDHDTRSLRQGAPLESRTDERRLQEDGLDEDPVPDALLTAGTDLGGLTHDDLEARTELAKHLQPSVFPARPERLVESATALGAPPAMVDALRRLPEDTYDNLQAVWAALSGAAPGRA